MLQRNYDLITRLTLTEVENRSQQLESPFSVCHFNVVE